MTGGGVTDERRHGEVGLLPDHGQIEEGIAARPERQVTGGGEGAGEREQAGAECEPPNKPLLPADRKRNIYQQHRQGDELDQRRQCDKEDARQEAPVQVAEQARKHQGQHEDVVMRVCHHQRQHERVPAVEDQRLALESRLQA